MSDTTDRKTNPIWINTLAEDIELIPKYQTSGSAGCDLRATEDRTISPGGRSIIGAGIKLELPKGYGAMVCPRSGLAARYGVTVLNSPGIIDNDYRGEVKVILHNAGAEEFIVRKGDRVAQLLFFPIMQAIFQMAEEVSSTDRGEDGFGSTGI